ncbi:MAG: J domain-containing protein [Terracidiphilus sp.]
MSCDCGQCRQHYRTLGIAYGIPSEVEIEEAYREGIKQWHPDLYENYANLRADAEEHFKQIQIAYRELKEHSGASEESPVISSPTVSSPAPDVPVDSFFTQPRSVQETPTLSFGGAPGCLVAQQFTTEIKEIVASHLGKIDTALAIVDLDGARSYAGYSHFFLLATRGIMVRDARNIVSLLWYKDLGEVNLIDKRKSGILGLSQLLNEIISGSQHNYSLKIYRSDGTHFFSITNQVDDNVKIVIYNFLLQQKTQIRP